MGVCRIVREGMVLEVVGILGVYQNFRDKHGASSSGDIAQLADAVASRWVFGQQVDSTLIETPHVVSTLAASARSDILALRLVSVVFLRWSFVQAVKVGVVRVRVISSHR